MPREDLLAVDVGNSRIKLGRFAAPDAGCVASAGSGVLPIAGGPLPEPVDTLRLSTHEPWGSELDDYAGEWSSPPRAVVGSVCRPGAERLAEALAGRVASWSELSLAELPIAVRVDEPETVGVDRLLADVAANVLRRPNTPAIVVDLGTAITVDLVAADGAFEGGAILPGPALAARALADATDKLPLVRIDDLEEAPDAVGRATESCIAAGLFWGAVGSIRELIDRTRDRLVATPQVFLTGGAAPSVARLLAGPDYTVRHVPHLTLAGIAVADGRLRGSA